MNLTPQHYARIKSTLRKLWLKSTERLTALNLAKVNLEVGSYKNGSKKYKLHWECAYCRIQTPSTKNVRVDHIVPINKDSKTWDDYINKLFCDPVNLQVLCLTCEARKTSEEATSRASSKAKAPKKRATKAKTT